MRICILALLFFLLPACKASQVQDSFVFDVAKVFTKAKIKQLFPGIKLERDTVIVNGTFKQAALTNIFPEDVRVFLSPEGHIEMKRREAFARVQWKRLDSEKVFIGLEYYKSPLVEPIKRDSL